MFFINIIVVFHIVVTKKVTTVKVCIKLQKSVIVNHYSVMSLFYRPRNRALIIRGNISIWFDYLTQWYAHPQEKMDQIKLSPIQLYNTA